jgi:glycosyltransferase involved in cell wall biosynthesis
VASEALKNRKKMSEGYKILHYVVGFSTLSETFIYDLILGLDHRKICENIVVCRKRTLEIERPYKEVIVLKESNIIFRALNKFTDPDHMQLQENRQLKNLIREFKPDVIHAHFGIAGIRINNFVQKNRIKIPVITSFHGSDVLFNPHNVKGYLSNLLKLNTNPFLIMTTPTQFLKNECLALGLESSKIHVMNNTINQMFLHTKQATPWNGKDKLRIVIVGRLVPMKGHEYALRALAVLKQTFSNFELHILGDGRSKETLQLLTQELGLREEVVFHGPVKHQDLPEALSKFHVSLTPSVKAPDGQEESFCISLIEASLVGLYCLASDAGGPNEVLKDKREFLYPQKDYDALAGKIMHFVEKYDQMNPKIKELQDFMLQHYHPDQYFIRYDQVYKRMMNKK